jgi:hypothetical protein
MRPLQRLLWPATAALVCGFVLARATPVFAPSEPLRRAIEVRGPVPADRYLDLGSPAVRPRVPAYSPPPHRWQSEDRGGEFPIDESLYIDIGALAL